MAFSSSTTVKTHLKISGTTYDALLTQLCTQIDAFITAETGVPTGASAGVTYTDEILDSDGSRIIRAKHHPITTLSAVKYRQADYTFTSYTDETISAIEKNDERIFTRYVVTGEGKRNLSITYIAGYKTTDVPTDLQLAAILIVVHLFNTRNNVGFNSLSTLGLQQSMAKDDYLYVSKILTKYKPAYAI